MRTDWKILLLRLTRRSLHLSTSTGHLPRGHRLPSGRWRPALRAMQPAVVTPPVMVAPPVVDVPPPAPVMPPIRRAVAPATATARIAVPIAAKTPSIAGKTPAQPVIARAAVAEPVAAPKVPAPATLAPAAATVVLAAPKPITAVASAPLPLAPAAVVPAVETSTGAVTAPSAAAETTSSERVVPESPVAAPVEVPAIVEPAPVVETLAIDPAATARRVATISRSVVLPAARALVETPQPAMALAATAAVDTAGRDSYGMEGSDAGHELRMDNPRASSDAAPPTPPAPETDSVRAGASVPESQPLVSTHAGVADAFMAAATTSSVDELRRLAVKADAEEDPSREPANAATSAIIAAAAPVAVDTDDEAVAAAPQRGDRIREGEAPAELGDLRGEPGATRSYGGSASADTAHASAASAEADPTEMPTPLGEAPAEPPSSQELRLEGSLAPPASKPRPAHYTPPSLAPAVEAQYNRTATDYRRPMPRPKVRGPVIDFHCHLLAARHARGWFEAADHYGIDCFLTMSPLEEVLPIQRDWGHRVQFIAVPRWGGDARANWLDDYRMRLESFYNLGSRIVKFHAAPGTMAMRGMRLDDPAYRPLLREAVARRMVIMTHIGDPDLWYSGKYAADPEKYKSRDADYRMWEDLLEEYRGTPWIGAHMGGNPEDLARLQSLLDRFPDLMLDCSATRWMAREISARRDAAREFFIRNADRLLFGTDQVSGDDRGFDFLASRFWVHRKLWETAYIGVNPILDPDVPEDQQPTLRGLALPDEVLQALYHDNGIKMLAKAGVTFPGWG